MSHIVKATVLKLLAKFHDDWSKYFVSNATSPNYANDEETHALTCLRTPPLWIESFALGFLFEYSRCERKP